MGNCLQCRPEDLSLHPQSLPQRLPAVHLMFIKSELRYKYMDHGG